MKRLVVLSLLCSSVLAWADVVTYTWKGGSGNWSDPAMWTASDGSTGYPNAIDAAAEFPVGTTGVVDFTEKILISNILVLADAAVTLRSPDAATRYEVDITKIKNNHGLMATGDRCVVTLDNLYVTSIGAARYGTAWTAYVNFPGAGGEFRMVNRAKIDIISSDGRQKTKGRVFIGANCEAYFGSHYQGVNDFVISNGYYFVSGVEALDGAKFVFQGNNPRYCPRAIFSRAKKVTYEFELPAEQYANYPIDPTEENLLENMDASGATFVVSKKSPARIAGYTNTWKIVAWESRSPKVSDVYTYANGIVTNQIKWARLRNQDGFSFAWRNQQDPTVANPAYMYLTLGRPNGLSVIVK